MLGGLVSGIDNSGLVVIQDKKKHDSLLNVDQNPMTVCTSKDKFAETTESYKKNGVLVWNSNKLFFIEIKFDDNSLLSCRLVWYEVSNSQFAMISGFQEIV